MFLLRFVPRSYMQVAKKYISYFDLDLIQIEKYPNITCAKGKSKTHPEYQFNMHNNQCQIRFH